MLAVIESLREIVQIAPGELLVEFLERIQDGVRPWIIDEREVFLGDEYNEQVCKISGLRCSVIDVAKDNLVLRGVIGSSQKVACLRRRDLQTLPFADICV